MRKGKAKLGEMLGLIMQSYEAASKEGMTKYEFGQFLEAVSADFKTRGVIQFMGDEELEERIEKLSPDYLRVH